MTSLALTGNNHEFYRRDRERLELSRCFARNVKSSRSIRNRDIKTKRDHSSQSTGQNMRSNICRLELATHLPAKLEFTLS